MTLLQVRTETCDYNKRRLLYIIVQLHFFQGYWTIVRESFWKDLQFFRCQKSNLKVSCGFRLWCVWESSREGGWTEEADNTTSSSVGLYTDLVMGIDVLFFQEIIDSVNLIVPWWWRFTYTKFKSSFVSFPHNVQCLPGSVRSCLISFTSFIN